MTEQYSVPSEYTPRQSFEDLFHKRDLGRQLLALSEVFHPVAEPASRIALVRQANHILACGERIVEIPPNHNGAIFMFWNVGLALGAIPVSAQWVSQGLSLGDERYGRLALRSGLSWLTGHRLNKGERLQSFFGRLLPNIELLPPDTDEDPRLAPGNLWYEPSGARTPPATSEVAELEVAALLAEAACNQLGVGGAMTCEELAELAGVRPHMILAWAATLPSDSALLRTRHLPRAVGDRTLELEHYSPDFVQWILRQIARTYPKR